MNRRRATPRVIVPLIVALVALAPACKRKAEDQQHVVVRNDGVLCLGADVIDRDAGKAFGALEPGQPLPVTIRSYGCLSDLCASEREAKCSAKIEGNKIILSSEMSWQAPDELRPCRGACSNLDAKCTVDGVAAGKYTVVLGAKSYPVEIPSRVESACLQVPKEAPAPISGLAPDAAAPAASVLQPAAVAALAAPPPTGAAIAAPLPPEEKICIMPLSPAAAKKGSKATAARLEPLSVSVTRRGSCIANSCFSGVPKCTAKKKGKDHITIAVTYPGGKASKKPCTEDCEAFAGTCKTEPLAAGAYTVEAAGHAAGHLVLPPVSTSPTCLP